MNLSDRRRDGTGAACLDSVTVARGWARPRRATALTSAGPCPPWKLQREAPAMILEGWSANVSFGGVSTDWADHTWVYAPANNRFFECWGGRDGPNKRHIVSGDGSYNRANCYRCPI